MAVACAAKLRERIEKVVVAGYSGRRNEAAHRESVYQRVKQMLILVSFRHRNFPVSTACVPRLSEGKGSEIHAQLVFRSRANPRFRIHRPAQMIVQVRAFGHFFQQIAQLQRIRASRFQVQSPAPLSFGLTGSSGTLPFALRPRPRREKEKTSETTDSQTKGRTQMFLSKTLRGWLFHLSSSGSDVNSRSRRTAYQEKGKRVLSLQRVFHLEENHTTVRRELLAGL